MRVGEGLDATGALAAGADGARARDARALRALLPRDRDRRRPRRRDVGDPRRRQPGEFLRARASAPGSRSRCSRAEEEARYGYLAAVNSTTLADGVVLDLGGGSMQLTRVDEPPRGRRALVAARRRAHDRALPARASSAKRKQIKALREHVAEAARARAVAAARRGGSSASAARSATSPRRPSSRPGCPRSASRASRHARRRSTSWSSGSPSCTPAERATVPGHQARARRPDPRRRARRPDA